ncbi:MAG: helix-turn-helix domain-containing protein [Blautia sp.]|nr:helix-turn-helix domain-containing protein [Blautia sp.]MCM1202456.1 helix-turn-helix domain-containing protein [Bacteroides fragilis]
MLGENLLQLRKLAGLSQEEIAGQIGVSRQALAKWETGETVPDIEKCLKLAQLYNVSLDDLVNYSEARTGLQIPPRGKHLFGAVTVGEKGQIVIPKRARDVFRIKKGDRLILLGDEEQGLALIQEEQLLAMVNAIREALDE